MSLPLSQSQEVILSQLDGQFRYMVLRNRSLPYQKVDFLCGKFNVVKTVYPGNPTASMQILGSQEKDLKLTGTWKDRFVEADLFDGSSLMTLSPLVNQGQGNAFALVEFVNLLRLQGQPMAIQWGDIYEEGVITDFTPSFIRLQDIEWTLEIELYKQDVSPSKTSASPLTGIDAVISDLQSIASAIQTASDALISIQGYLGSIILRFSSAINGIVGGIAYTMDNLVGLGDVALAGITIPVSTYVSAVSLLTRLSSFSTELQRKVNTFLSQITAPSTAQDMAVWMDVQTTAGNLSEKARDMVLAAMKRQQEYLDHLTKSQSVVKQYRAKDGDNLRTISQKFYGTQDRWQYLADVNFLPDSRLSAGTVILIPLDSQIALGRAA